jgi:arsenic resistance protein ArsH
MAIELPNISAASLTIPSLDRLNAPSRVSTHPPRILLLYGSMRERSFSRLLTLEVDAHVYDSEPILCGQGLSRIWRR